MRAARLHQYGPPEVIVLDEVDVPDPGPGEVRLVVHATSVNPVDCKIRAGDLRFGVRWSLPHTLGLDVSGVVDAVGPGVTAFQVGDAVYACGSHLHEGTAAERAVLPVSELALRPAGLTHAEAASLPLVAQTAWDCLVHVARLQAGERVLILGGAGGVGTVAIQLAKALGAEVATTASPRNIDLVRSLGADHVVDYTAADPAAVLPPQDVTLVAVGGDGGAVALRATRRGGRITHIVGDVPHHVARYGAVLGVAVAGVHIAAFTVGSRLRGRRGSHVIRRPVGETLARITALVDEGRIRPVIDSAFGLDALAEAHRRVETGRASGKVVVTVP